MNLKKMGSLIVWCGLCLSIGWLGSLATQSSLSDWYLQLNKPAWTPPSWVFAPVWTLLYFAMGISVWLIWERRNLQPNKAGIIIFCIQLALNGAWSWSFFYLRNPGAGVVNIFLLWLAILITIMKFRQESRTAAWLLAPYLLWVSYAAALNIAIYRLN